MPATLLTEYLKAIPRLQAAEALMEAQVVRVGAGFMKPEAQRSILNRWSRIAFGSGYPKGKQTKMDPQKMAAMGLGVRQVKSDG